VSLSDTMVAAGASSGAHNITAQAGAVNLWKVLMMVP
jgi:hypothetical protein